MEVGWFYLALEIRGHKLHTKWWGTVISSFSVRQLSMNSPILTSLPVILVYKSIFSLWPNTEYSLFAKLLTVYVCSALPQNTLLDLIRYLKISSRKQGEVFKMGVHILLSWSSNQVHAHDYQKFLFSINSERKYPLSNSEDDCTRWNAWCSQNELLF